MGPAAGHYATHGSPSGAGGAKLHYLAERANITDKFSDAECLKLDVAFPHFISQMESMLTTGEMNLAMPTVSPCTTMVSPAKPIPLVVAATYISPFIPLNANEFHESKHENSKLQFRGRRSPVCRPLQSGKCFLHGY